jgi:shikimate kinase
MSERDDLSSLLGPDENIVILGPPGGGKTSLAKVLSRHLSLSIYDIDDDHLEQVWGCTVASKLTQLGDDLFVQAEGEALCLVKKTRTVISLSGSNPLHEAGMRTLRENNPNSIFLYLDVSRNDIIQRLEAMKVNRIVGQVLN